MSTALADLTIFLSTTVPQRNGAPADYAELVKSAVWQLSGDVPIVRQADISIQPGVSTYALPSDFLNMIVLTPLAQMGDTIVGGNNLIAVGALGYQEQVWTEGSDLRISPTPQYNATRMLRYAAAHVLNSDNKYPLLSANGARIALLYGQYLALQEQAAKLSGDGWMYRIGDETVDKRGQGAAIQAQALAVLTSYQNAVKPLKGYGSQYRYSAAVDGEASV